MKSLHMSKRFISFISCFLTAAHFFAQTPGTIADSTLRLDYTFSGNTNETIIALHEARTTPGWYGRNVNTDTLLLRGNGRIVMRDAATDSICYCQSFSTLYQEWLTTEEATRTTRAFENVFLLPMPRNAVVIELELNNFKGGTLATLRHSIDPRDILIRPAGTGPLPPHRYLLYSDRPERAIDIAIVAEGYTADEMEAFYAHARTAMDALMGHEPFKTLRDRFNVVAVATPSAESGVSIPHKGLWKQTAVHSHFDTFYSERYLTTLHLGELHDWLAGIPYEHIIILANTDNYGGGGIFNSYTLTTARHASFEPVVVHEFGHSFAGLADEYFYDDQYEEFYYPDIEPWEQNITTLCDFSTKWEDLLPRKCVLPRKDRTNVSDGETETVGLYEGAGYQSRGVYRPCWNCRMRTNEAPVFCFVCRRAIDRLIRYYTEVLPR